MKGLCARDVMTVDPVTVTEDTPVVDVARILSRRHISGLPVVDDSGALVGIVSEADLLVKQLEDEDLHPTLNISTGRMREQRRRFEGRVAGEVMTQYPVTANEETPVSSIARTMIHQGINRLPVVREGRLVGIVTRNDLLKSFERSDAEIYEDIERFLLDDLWVDPTRLHIRVENGVVTIQGEVDEQAEARLIASGARLQGVADVDTSRLRLAGKKDRKPQA